ncbi:uncharacterized protein TrAtP1_008904 [Trichoderma atroviride]|uniref:uncharacterized protein n=1 Tax=Hypocrea atroviridis TaxID=63577 RepID=UPI00331A8F7C|nr:hypothetical protein TrAtP1_008904 [Trichoderma atroviride]
MRGIVKFRLSRTPRGIPRPSRGKAPKGFIRFLQLKPMNPLSATHLVQRCKDVVTGLDQVKTRKDQRRYFGAAHCRRTYAEVEMQRTSFQQSGISALRAG